MEIKHDYKSALYIYIYMKIRSFGWKKAWIGYHARLTIKRNRELPTENSTWV